MKINKKTRAALKLETLVFFLLFFTLISLVAWLSIKYNKRYDITQSGSNTLSQHSQEVLRQMPDKIVITAYVDNSKEIRQVIRDVISRFHQHKNNIELRFVNTELSPDEVRANQITQIGELLIKYHGRSAHAKVPQEQEITNVLRYLARTENRWIVFLQGHGERHINGKANFDWGVFGEKLSQNGYKAQNINLKTNPFIPDNTAALVLASPQTKLTTNEIAIIDKYIADGGNAFLLAEPNEYTGISPLIQPLGIEFYSGTVRDPNSEVLYKIQDNTFAVTPKYPEHAITDKLSSVSIFPKAAAIKTPEVVGDYVITKIIETLPQSWTIPQNVNITSLSQLNKLKVSGPLTLGVALSKKAQQSNIEQRIFIAGDGDFLSNQFIGNGANLSLGFGIISWLTNDDDKVSIPPPIIADKELNLTVFTAAIFELGFKIIAPALLALCGLIIHIYRKVRK
ncbi:MAG: hypothetical protein D6B28_00780 [Gammaproteobacteria bacterium]|nr:MAG: hypothetical protein D6B28_00780 [Gammaproteobacteria bacterium]